MNYSDIQQSQRRKEHTQEYKSIGWNIRWAKASNRKQVNAKETEDWKQRAGGVGYVLGLRNRDHHLEALLHLVDR